MSVLECNRRGCGNIMCDRYSYDYGYICDECFDELIDKGIHTDIEEFMNSPKKKYIAMEEDSFAHFSHIFTRR